MRRTRLRWMYLPRTPKKEEKEHPLQVQNAQQFLRSAAVLATFTCALAAFMSLRKLQTRRRQAEQELLRKRNGQRVVVIGAGAGGAAATALLASASPELRITVIEKDRQQVFQGQVALAHVGHRSYDLGTTTGVDVLRSPATWNVTREANLVAAEVLKVDPESKQVFVRTSQSMLASAKPLDEEGGEGGGKGKSWGSSLTKWAAWSWLSSRHTPTTISHNEDGSANLSDGTTVFSYDALVVAAGAHRTLGHLREQLQSHQVDSYRIAVNPGTTRDSLACLFSGNVVHVKVPPASFVWQMERARTLAKRSAAVEPAVADIAAAPSAGRAVADAAITASAAAPWTPANLLSSLKTWASGEAHQSDEEPNKPADSSTTAVASSIIPDEVAWRVSTASPSSAAAASACVPLTPVHQWPLYFLAQWCMRFSSRQHDSTFVSTTNTIYRYLAYYNKLSLCQLFTVTADVQPIGPAPAKVNRAIERLWRERQLACHQGSADAPDGERFHVLYHSYITSVNANANVATFYDYKNNAEVHLPYHLMLLDLPLRAPAFVRQSGLHRTRYVEESVVPALVEGTHQSAELGRPPGDSASSSTVPSAAAATAAAALRSNPLLGATKTELEQVFADEMSFMDVNPTTLQHRRYEDVFAIGDVAGLPSPKSYGAVYAQAPVVAHNVRQVLKGQEMMHMHEIGTDAHLRSETPVSAASADGESLPREKSPRVNAHYAGYSSFHVIMSTWRAMWPEMRYPIDPYSPDSSTPSEAEAARKSAWDVVSPMTYCNHHMWDNLAWRDPRGCLNGFYYQSALYELMHFFAFSRGLWHPPTWFSVPSFSQEDGTPRYPSILGLL